MKRIAFILMMLVQLSAMADMPSYEWVDLRRTANDGTTDQGTIRLVYQSSAVNNTSHTYRLTAAGGGLWGADSVTEAQIIASDLGGTYGFTMSFTSTLIGVNDAAVIENVPNPTPSQTDTGPNSHVLQIMQWGPERQDQNADGLHEPREWIKIRLTWADSEFTKAGTWTGDITGNGGAYAISLTDVFEKADGTGFWTPGTTELVFDANGAISALARNGNGGIWTKGNGSGDYVGPLDAPAAGNDWNFLEYVILEQGPTVGGPGDDGIGGGDDVAPPIDDPGDGEPGPDDIPPPRDEEDEEVSCLDEKLAELEDLLDITWLSSLQDSPQQVYTANVVLDGLLPNYPIYFTFRSDFLFPGYEGTHAAITEIRDLLRSILTVFIAYFGLMVTHRIITGGTQS